MSLKVRKFKLATRDTRTTKEREQPTNLPYRSQEHRAWAAEVIKRSGGHCQGPNCSKPPGWRGLLYADHVHELRDGGAPFDPRNGMALCGSCHTSKTLAERRRRLLSAG